MATVKNQINDNCSDVNALTNSSQSSYMNRQSKGTTGRIQMGLNIIGNAFECKIKSLEDDLMLANKERAELEEKMIALHTVLVQLERNHVESTILQSRLVEVEERLIEKSAEYENIVGEHRKTEQDLINENKRLAEQAKLYKRKTQQLEDLRQTIAESLKHDASKEICFTKDISTNWLNEKPNNTNEFPHDETATNVATILPQDSESSQESSSMMHDGSGRSVKNFNLEI